MDRDHTLILFFRTRHTAASGSVVCNFILIILIYSRIHPLVHLAEADSSKQLELRLVITIPLSTYFAASVPQHKT